VKKSEHGVIAFVITDSDVIHVMSQASDEVVAIRNRRNLHQRNRATEDHIAKQGDMYFQSRCCSMRLRLADSEQMANFIKQIKPDAHRFPVPEADFDRNGSICFLVQECRNCGAAE